MILSHINNYVGMYCSNTHINTRFASDCVEKAFQEFAILGFKYQTMSQAIETVGVSVWL